MKKITLLLFCMFMPSVVFGAEVLMDCGSSKGEEYSFIDGWQKTSISSGKIILVADGDELDVLVSTSVQKLESYREMGFNVVTLYIGEGYIRLGAFANKVTEIFNFSIEDKKVAWSVNRSGDFFPKTSVYLADCE